MNTVGMLTEPFFADRKITVQLVSPHKHEAIKAEKAFYEFVRVPFRRYCDAY